MIGKLRGKIDSVQEDKCILDVNGVGYLVYISAKNASNLKNLTPQAEISLCIETVVKEDAIELYGFMQEIEKIWFLELTKVQGVGSKMGQKILSALNIEELAKALSVADIKTFQNISGIGPKLAQRICVELKNSPKNGKQIFSTLISFTTKILFNLVQKVRDSKILNLISRLLT